MQVAIYSLSSDQTVRPFPGSNGASARAMDALFAWSSLRFGRRYSVRRLDEHAVVAELRWGDEDASSSTDLHLACRSRAIMGQVLTRVPIEPVPKPTRSDLA